MSCSNLNPDLIKEKTSQDCVNTSYPGELESMQIRRGLWLTDTFSFVYFPCVFSALSKPKFYFFLHSFQ